MDIDTARRAIDEERTALGIELGSTRIKACLVDEEGGILAVGAAEWENRLVDGYWSYPLDDVRERLQEAYAALAADVRERYGQPLRAIGAIGVSAMMHGYLAFDDDGRLLVPFRTWRNVTTTRAAERLSEALDWNMPVRWSIAHLYQAVLDGEPHVASVARITTLAGHVHELLTGERVLGIGDASGMFPTDPATGAYDADRLARTERLLADAGWRTRPLSEVLPTVRSAGEHAGALTEAGAALLDPSGTLRPGAIAAPPEGDAGTGMVATDTVTPRRGNVSAGTSIFAMVVLERPLQRPHPEIDVVATPSGDMVAMVHCNNGASEIGVWASVFSEFAAALGVEAAPDRVFAAFLSGALEDGTDEGLLAYNLLSGEPVAGLDEGRPLFVRAPSSSLSLAGFGRAQLRGAFAALSLGMRALAEEDVAVDEIRAHGGIFRTAGVAQRLLAAALGAPVAVSKTAAEGGAWGMALLAAYRRAVAAGERAPLAEWLATQIFRDVNDVPVAPTDADIRSHEAYLERWMRGLDVERAAVRTT